MNPVALGSIVRVRSRFHRSVHLARDFGSGFEEGFLATPAVLALAEQIVGELGRSGGARAWTVTGPYGGGKSAFALFLARLLATPAPADRAAAHLRRRHLRGKAPLRPVLIQAERGPLAPALLAAVAGRSKVLRRRALELAGQPAACAELLLEAAKRSRGGIALIVDELGKFLEYAAADPAGDVFLLQQIAEAAARSRKPILFVSILHSGFGDYLSANEPARRAEWQKVQGRFRDLPFSLPAEQLLELVGHAIEQRWPRPVRRAYRERLRLLQRQNPAIFAHVSQRTEHGAPPDLHDDRGDRSSHSADATFSRANGDGGRAEDTLAACLPLHPATALLLWPLFRSKAAQNERSLFAFLSGFEPHGFQEFLAEEQVGPGGGTVPLYRLDRLYDYVRSALGMAALTGADARRWSLIEHALERVPAKASPVASRLVKAVGLLSLYGAAVGLKPDKAVLRTVLDDVPAARVDSALKGLRRRKIVLFRQHQQAYGLWEGSDIDLDLAFEQALAQRSRDGLDARLGRLVEPRPLVARAHYVRTGTLRFFEPRIAAATAGSCRRVLGKPTKADGVLLFLLPTGKSGDRDTLGERVRGLSRELRLPGPGAAGRRGLQARNRRLDEPAEAGRDGEARRSRPVLVAALRRPDELAGCLDDLEAWQWVRENVSRLAGDAVARQEVAAREAGARARFEQVAGRTFGLSGHVLDPGASRWYLIRGDQDPAETTDLACGDAGVTEITDRVAGPRGLQEAVSTICGDAYGKAPVLRNELLNRHNLSSAAARARRELIARVFESSELENLGMEGYPPEYSMYLSLLRDGGFHAAAAKGAWRLQAPPENGPAAEATKVPGEDPQGAGQPGNPAAPRSGGWRPVWNEINRFALSTRNGERSLSELIEALESPPYGLRQGPIPVLIAMLLKVSGDRLALYEDGLFVPQVEIETLERLVRRPETFAIRTYELSRTEQQVLRAVAAKLPMRAGEGSVLRPAAKSADPRLMSVVRELVRVAAQLPPYARRTTSLSPEAQAVRLCLLDARDPRRLLFEELPRALGQPVEVADTGRPTGSAVAGGAGLEGPNGPERFADALDAALRELTGALPRLLESVEASVRETFGIDSRPGRQTRVELRERLMPLQAHTELQRLQLFVEAATRGASGSGEEWRTAIALAIGEGLPPDRWDDHRAARIGQGLRALRLELDDLLDVVQVAGSGPAVAVASIRVRTPGGEPTRTAFPCPPGDQPAVDSLLEEWRRAARRGGRGARVQLQALARLAQELDVLEAGGVGDAAGAAARKSARRPRRTKVQPAAARRAS